MSEYGFDEGRARAFSAFPPDRGRGRFARSWWGNAWISAMEDTALDNNQLRHGRRYARAGLVGTIVVSPGRIEADVRDNGEGELYHAVVGIEQLGAADWERFLGQVAAKAGHIAALLDKDMPHDLVEVAEDAGVRLLPGIGDLEPECSCPGWELPCGHAAALSYQAARLLDEDPFVLLLMRGRGDRELLDSLQRRNARLAEGRAPAEHAPGASGGGRAAGEPAGPAFARAVPPLPAPAPLPAETGPLPVLPPAPGLHPAALGLLAADAAARARALLAAQEPPPELDLWADTVRFAAAHPDPELFARLARGVPDRDLDGAVRAWRYSGADGLRVLEAAWSPPKSDLARARTALAAMWAESGTGEVPELRMWRNRCTVPAHGLQVRLGDDGRWHPYREENGGAWRPAGLPHRDPAVALAELLAG